MQKRGDCEMKKIMVMCALIMCLLLTSCNATVSTEEQYSGKDTKKSMFIIVEETTNWDVVYHKETKVMYVVSRGAYNQGAFTLLVNADGTPMIWDGE